MQDQLHRMEAALVRVETMLHTLMNASTKKQRAAKQRRKQYSEAKQRRERGKVSLPTFHVLKVRDNRLTPRIQGWADAGMKFGAADNPEGFLAWFCYQWNNTCYLKKPITFSAGYYRVHTGDIRCKTGSFDLMGLNVKQKMVLRNDAELYDFSNRPWWTWAFKIFYPVWEEMQEMPGFAELGPRFLRGVRLILGGYDGHEVYTGLLWDANESRVNINKMFRRMGPALRLMWKACCSGLRMKSSPVVPA